MLGAAYLHFYDFMPQRLTGHSRFEAPKFLRAHVKHTETGERCLRTRRPHVHERKRP